MGKVVPFHRDFRESTPENILEEDDNIMTHDENHLHFDDTHTHPNVSSIQLCLIYAWSAFEFFFPYIFPCLFYSRCHSIHSEVPANFNTFFLSFFFCSLMFSFANATHVYVHHTAIELLTTVEMSELFTNCW